MANTKSEIQRELEKEIRSKAVTARNARYRKRGSKSKQCSLPSDGMTNKQWKERNGEVMEYNMRKPMGWREFKAMPLDIQRMYLEGLRNRHNASAKVVAEMFGIHNTSLSTYIHKHDLTGIFAPNGGKQLLRGWDEFIRGEVTGQESEEQPANEGTEAAPTADHPPLPAENRYAA